VQFLFDNSGGAMKPFKKIAQQSNETFFRKTLVQQCIFLKNTLAEQ